MRRRDFDGCSLDGCFDADKCLSVGSDLTYLLSDRLGTCSLRPLVANYVLEQVSVVSGLSNPQNPVDNDAASLDET